MAKQQTKNIGTDGNNSAPTPKKGRRKAAAAKASTRSTAGSNATTMKLVGQAAKALARANGFLNKIK